MSERPYLSIGEVLGLLLEEFPDVTISKIRFLESQGLIEPERTPSGYRKFFDDDVERLRFILREQKDNYLPLKVIKGRLDDSDPSGEMAAVTTGGTPEPLHSAVVETSSHPSARATGSPPVSNAAPVSHLGRDVTDALERPELLGREDVIAMTGIDDATLADLETFGLITPKSRSAGARYDAAACEIAEIAARFVRLGIEVRHLRAWQVAADRQVGLFEQRVMPLMRQRNPRSRTEVGELIEDLVGLGDRLHAALVNQAVRSMVDPR